MSFISKIDLTGIGDAAGMSRAIQCMFMSMCDRADVSLYADTNPCDEDRDKAIELRHESFIVVDHMGGEFRITVTDGRSIRPARVSPAGVAVLALGHQLGMARAAALLALAGRIGADAALAGLEALDKPAADDDD